MSRSAPALGLLVLVACGDIPVHETDPVVLSLGERVVRRSAFERHLAESELPEQAGLTDATRRALFDAFVEERLLVLAAEERGLLDAGADEDTARAAAQRLAAQIGSKAARVGADEVRRHYDAHGEEFEQPELVALRQILVPTLNEARDVKRRLGSDPKSFETLARRLSRGPEASDGGRMGSFARGELPTPLEEAAFALAPGRTSGIVETPLGFHVLRLEERSAARVRPFEECRDEILARLAQDRADAAVRAFVRSLEARAQVNHDAATRPLDPP